jgi:hypothetical protein
MDKDLERILQDVTEELKNLHKVLSSTNKTIMRDSKNLSKTRAHTKETMIDLTESVDDGTEKMASFKKEVTQSTKEIDKMGKKASATAGVGGLLVKALKFVAKTIWAVGTAMVKTALAFSDVTKSIDGLEDMVAAGFGDIPVIGPLMKEFGREIDANVGHFKSLAKQGASFGSSIVEMRNLQAQSTMPLEKFTGLIGGNSEMLAKLFGTVDKGAPRIAALTGKLRDITERDFAKFGLTLDDTSEYMMTYQNLQRARGNTERMSNAQLLQGTAKYTKNLVLLSKLTGKNVEELDKANSAMAADGVFQSTLSGMEADRAAKLTQGMAGLDGPLKQFAKEIIGVGAPISDASRELEAMSGGRLGEAVKQFKKDGDLTAFQNSIKTISADVMKSSKSYGQASLAGGGFAEALNALTKAAGIAVDPAEIAAEQAAAGADNIENLVNLSSTIDRVKTAFEKARFDVLTPLIYKNSEAVTHTTARINDGFKKLANEGIPNMVKKLEKMGGAFNKDAGDDTGGSKSGKKKWYKPWTWFSDSDAKANAPADEAYSAQHGTGGKYVDFGTGTKAVLHGEEAILPKGDKSARAALTGPTMDEEGGGGFAEALTALAKATGAARDNNPIEKFLASMKAKAGAVGKTATGAATSLMESNSDKINKDLLETTVNIESHLNKLVAINMATERNTKTTNKELADMGGSIV